MMTTITDIETAQSKIATAADFPKFVQELKEMGIQKFRTLVANSQSVYWQKDGPPVISEAMYEPLALSYTTDFDTFCHQLKLHQEGKTDYYTFCLDAAKTGIEKWVMDLNKMTCTYFDHAGDAILIESVPSL